MKEGFIETELINVVKSMVKYDCVYLSEFFSDVSASLQSITFTVVRYWGDQQYNVILKKPQDFSFTTVRTPNLSQSLLFLLFVVSYWDQNN